jgi:hypothetical protein
VISFKCTATIQQMQEFKGFSKAMSKPSCGKESSSSKHSRAHLGVAAGLGLGPPGTSYTATMVTSPFTTRVMLGLVEVLMSAPVMALYTSQRTKVVVSGAFCVSV